MDEGLGADAPVALFALSGEARLLTVNRTFEILTGAPRDEAVGRPLRSFFTATSQILYALKVEPPLLATGGVQEILVEIAAPGGVALPALLTVIPDVSGETRQGVLFPAPERRAYELELIAARKAADQANAARDLLLREVYHRVKNNLQTIDSLLLLQARRLQDSEAVAALQVMRERVFALGLVHHQLMGSVDLKTFDVSVFLRDLVGHLREAGGDRVRIDVTAPSMPVGLDFAIPLGLIVTELVTNALKHAFPTGGGVVRVEMALAGDEVVLTVADDGVGQPADAGPASFGLSIVRGLAGQLGGQLRSFENGGSVFELRSPLPRLA